MNGPLARPLRVVRLVRRAAKLYDASAFSVARRALRLYRVEGYRLSEAAPIGLLDPSLTDDDLAMFMSRKALRPAQERLNPSWLTVLTEDKAVFYLHCRRIGLPVPELYALLFQGSTGWGRGDLVLTSHDEWRSLLRSLPEDFVVKPTRASHGTGLALYRRDGDAFVDHLGVRSTADELLDRLEGHPTLDAWVIQERVLNHPDLVRLSGSDTLQTVRAYTLLESDWTCRVIGASLKIVGGEAVVDNIQDGRTGNFAASVSLEDGRLKPAIRESAETLTRSSLVVHPRTGVRFEDVVLPHWTEACELVKRAAREFAPLRTLGWDVALGTAGPVLVEANAWWAPPNHVGTMSQLLPALTGAAPASSRDGRAGS